MKTLFYYTSTITVLILGISAFSAGIITVLNLYFQEPMLNFNQLFTIFAGIQIVFVICLRATFWAGFKILGK